MSPAVSFTQALADWSQKGRNGRFTFAGTTLSAKLSESFEECVYTWLQHHHDPDDRARTSSEIAGGLRSWATGEFSTQALDVRASFKALEFMLGVSLRLPCLIDNAEPLLAVLKSRYFDALPDVGGPVPLKPAILNMSIAAVGSWCLDGTFDVASANADACYATGELVMHVTTYPGLTRQDAIVCLAVALLVAPGLLRSIVKNLVPVLPSIHQLKADTDRYQGVREVLSYAAKRAPYEIADAFTGEGLHSYLELVDLQAADEFMGEGQRIAMEPDRANRTMNVAKLRPRVANANHEVIFA